jgi:hypothetical protein
MKIFEETNIHREVIFILAVGLIMLVLGAVLFSVAAGALPYYRDGVYGLLLVIFGLQLQIIGKIPFGSVQRSWSIRIPGIIITLIGIFTCFIPGIFGDVPKFLVMIAFGAGGVLLFLQIFFANETSWFWKTPGDGANAHLSVICAAVSVLDMLIAVLIAVQIYRPALLSTELLAVAALLFGSALFCLAFILQKEYSLRAEPGISANTPGISPGTVMGMQFGFYMLIFGCLLVPVYLGLLPYALSAVHGTLMVLLGVQALVCGVVMTFSFKRTWIFFLVGMVFVAVGAFAIIVPDTIVESLVIFIGVFLILAGLYLLYTLIRPKPKPEGPAGKLEGRDLLLVLVLLALALLIVIMLILLGVSMLIENLVPGIFIVVILVCFGLVQFALLYVQSIVERKHLLG